MKIDLSNIPEAARPNEVLVGDVYPSKCTTKTVFWLVAAITGRSCHLLGLDTEGNIVSTSSYGLHAMEGRPRIGVVPEFAEMSFTVQREERP
jgi:hypothetical protein